MLKRRPRSPFFCTRWSQLRPCGDGRRPALPQAIREGRADVGLGLLAAARGAGLSPPAVGLDFIPLFQERFDLVLEASEMGTPPVAELLEYLNSAEGRTRIASLEGYDTAHSGEMLTP